MYDYDNGPDRRSVTSRRSVSIRRARVQSNQEDEDADDDSNSMVTDRTLTTDRLYARVKPKTLKDLSDSLHTVMSKVIKIIEDKMFLTDIWLGQDQLKFYDLVRDTIAQVAAEMEFGAYVQLAQNNIAWVANMSSLVCANVLAPANITDSSKAILSSVASTQCA